MSWPKYLNNPILNTWGEREERGREGGKKEKKTTEKRRNRQDRGTGQEGKGGTNYRDTVFLEGKFHGLADFLLY